MPFVLFHKRAFITITEDYKTYLGRDQSRSRVGRLRLVLYRVLMSLNKHAMPRFPDR